MGAPIGKAKGGNLLEPRGSRPVWAAERHHSLSEKQTNKHTKQNHTHTQRTRILKMTFPPPTLKNNYKPRVVASLLVNQHWEVGEKVDGVF